MRFKKKALEKIDRRKISKGKDCLWNVYKRFGYDIHKKAFKDNPSSPLYENCIWTIEQELEMIDTMRDSKIICHVNKTHKRQKRYNCHGCMLLFYFPTIEKY